MEGPEQGFFYAKAREWVQIDPSLDHKAKHVYLVFLSLAEAYARGQISQVTKDLARFCCAGVNNKPMSPSPFKRAVAALEEHGLLELASENGVCERDEHGRWRPTPGLFVRVHELPPEPDAFTGFRNIADLATTYPGEGWTERDYQRRIPSSDLGSNSTQGANSENADHPSSDLGSNSTRNKLVRSTDSAPIDQRPETSQTTREAGWLEANKAETAPGGRNPDPRSELEHRALSLLQALVMPHGPQYDPQQADVEHVVAALDAEVPERRIHDAITSGIAGAERPAATVKRRCAGLWKIAAASRRESGSQPVSELARPEWCGSCEEKDRTFFTAEEQVVQCPRCNPSIVGWVERVPA